MLPLRLVIPILLGATLRPARACLAPRYPTHTSSPWPLNPIQSLAFMTNPEPDSHSPPTSTIQNDQKPRYRPCPDYSHDSVSEIIQRSLQHYCLSHWGFVIFRCTYRSQAKWDKFISLAKRHALEFLERDGAEQMVYDHLHWTVIEDAAALDGADIFETSHRFAEWVNEGAGSQEMVDTAFNPGSHYAPRYTMFIHVDEESLESVVDETRIGEKEGYLGKIVYGANVISEEEEALAGEYRPEEAGEDDVKDDSAFWDLRKRVWIEDLVGLYARLQANLNTWYYLVADEDVIDHFGL